MPLQSCSWRPYRGRVERKPIGLSGSAFIALSLLSALALAQNTKLFDPQTGYDPRVKNEILDNAGQWRKATPEENQWRAHKDETVQNRRFHFGSDSAYEEMHYQNNDRYRNMGSTYDDVRPSSLFQYNF
jgi:hypothetical protein